MAFMEFVSSMLEGGRERIREAISTGLEPVHFHDADAATVYQYLVGYIKDYEGLPTRATIEGDTGVVLPACPPEPFDFWMEKTKELRTLGHLNTGLQKLGAAVMKKDVDEGISALNNTQKVLREQHLIIQPVVPLWGQLPLAKKRYKDIQDGKRGIPFPWKTVTGETLGMWPKDLIVFVARTGVGKCVEARTELMDPQTGVVRTIREVCEASLADIHLGSERTGLDPFKDVRSWSKSGGLVTRSIQAKVDTGTKRCLQFVLESGKRVIVTPEHPFILPDGWRRADRVRIGETVGTPSRMGFPEMPEALSPEDVDLLAVLLADGSYTGHHVSFSKGDPEVVRVATEAAEVKGAAVRRVSRYDYTFTGGGDLRRRVNPVRELLREHGIDRTLSRDKAIPDAVFRLDREQLARFLSIFWMCDGYVDNGPGIVLASGKMLRQISHLLLRFGIRSSVHYKPTRLKGAVFDAWRLRVYAESWEAFDRELSLWGPKAVRMKALLAKRRNPNTGSPRCWDGERIRRYKRCHIHEKGVRGSEPWWWSSGLVWDRVVEIREAGFRRVFDLTVPGTECFVANDVVVHNTWVLINLALKAWKKKHRVLFLTTEMAQETILQRFAAMYFRLPYRMLRRGKLPKMDEQRFFEGVEELKDAVGLDIIGGQFDFRLESIDGAIEEADCELAIVDGAYLLRAEGKTRTERMAEVFNEFKRICISREVALAASTQFNREAKKGKPQSNVLENIGLSDVVGWNADLAFALTQTEEMVKSRRMGVIPMKGRETLIPPFDTHWDFELMDFSEIDDDTVDDGLEEEPIF